MNELQMILQPMIDEFGPDVSAAVYKLPPSVKADLVGGIVSQEPALKAQMDAGRAKVMGAMVPDGESVLAIGGHLDPDVFLKIHGVLMSIDGVQFVVGAGSGCARLPRTSLGMAAVGAHERATAAKKPWWRFWK